MNEVSKNQERDTLGAFAGLIVLMAVLAILFGISAPKGQPQRMAVVNTEFPSTVTIILTELPTNTAQPTNTPLPTITLQPTELPSSTPLPTIVPTSVPTVAADNSNTEASTFDPEQLARGQTLFVTCSACHGPDGRGIVGLGKDLITGEFALTTTDADLALFIMTGRPIWDAANTTGIDMPPRGGNPALTDEDIAAIVVYLRNLQSSAGASGNVAEVTEAPSDASASAENVAATSYDPELVARGQTLFVTCSACHGVDGRGIVGLGKDLITGEFALTTTDVDLALFIMTGRPIWDAANTTGIDMPPRGGNPALTDADVAAIVAYLRTLQAP